MTGLHSSMMGKIFFMPGLICVHFLSTYSVRVKLKGNSKFHCTRSDCFPIRSSYVFSEIQLESTMTLVCGVYPRKMLWQDEPFQLPNRLFLSLLP